MCGPASGSEKGLRRGGGGGVLGRGGRSFVLTICCSRDMQNFTNLSWQLRSSPSSSSRLRVVGGGDNSQVSGVWRREEGEGVVCLQA